MTSSANRCSCSSGSSSGQKTNVSKLSSRANPVKVSIQCSGGPLSGPFLAPSVIVPPTLKRRRISAGSRPTASAPASMAPLHRGDALGCRPEERRHPAVSEPSGQRERARLPDSEPDLDRIRGRRAGVETPHRVVLAPDRDRPLATPEGSDHPDRLLERREGLAARADGPAHRADRLPESARSKTELEAPARERVERRCLLCDDRGAPERQVRDVREDADPVRAREEVGAQRPGVEEAPLVGVVLNPDQAEPELVRAAGERAGEFEICARGHDAEPELERAAVPGGHSGTVASGCQGRSRLRGRIPSQIAARS